MALKRHGETPTSSPKASTTTRTSSQYPKPCSSSPEHWRSQSYNALHYQQEHFEHMLSKNTSGYSSANDFLIQRHWCDVEASFRHQQRGLFSESISGSAQALEDQRRSLVQEPTAEMGLSGGHIAGRLSQLRSELQLGRLHAEGQSDEFQQSQAERRTPVLLQKLLAYELETRNSSPKSRYLKTEETELLRQLRNLRQQNVRVIQMTNTSMNTRNPGFTQQLQTSDPEISRFQTEVFDISEIR